MCPSRDTGLHTRLAKAGRAATDYTAVCYLRPVLMLRLPWTSPEVLLVAFSHPYRAHAGCLDPAFHAMPDACAGHLWLALFTFLYIDLLDCTGTLLSMARLMDHMLPGLQGPLSSACPVPQLQWPAGLQHKSCRASHAAPILS